MASQNLVILTKIKTHKPFLITNLADSKTTFKSGDVRTRTSQEPTPVPSQVVLQPPIRRLTTPGMLAKKRAQVESDRLKAVSFRTERVPILRRLGEVDHLIEKYDWAVQSGAAEVVEMRERMSWEQEEERREQIALEARGQLPNRAKKTSSVSTQGHSPSTEVAGPSRERPASPRGGAPRAISSPKRFVGTIPKFRGERGTEAQEERARYRENCGWRGGRSSRSQSRPRGPRARGGQKPQHHSSAGARDRNGDRVVSHPPQDRGRRAGAGQRARNQGHRSQVDSHGRSFGDSTIDWSEDGHWDEQEEGEE